MNGLSKIVEKVNDKFTIYIKKKVKSYLTKGVTKIEGSTFKKIPASSIVLPQTQFDFRTSKKDDKIYVVIGERCIVNATFTFESAEGNVEIGNNVHLGNVHFVCRNKIIIEDDVTMAWGIILYDHDSHSVYWEYRKNDNRQCYEDYLKYSGNNIFNKDWSHVVSKPIKVCTKAWIGFDVTILKGVTIGEGAVVGAKSVVTKDVAPFTLVAGNPARFIRNIDVTDNHSS